MTLTVPASVTAPTPNQITPPGLPGLQGNFGAAGAQNLPLPGFIHVTCPHMYRWAKAGEDEEAFASRLATELEDTIVREGPETIAAMIAEPLMGAGGVSPSLPPSFSPSLTLSSLPL